VEAVKKGLSRILPPAIILTFQRFVANHRLYHFDPGKAREALTEISYVVLLLGLRHVRPWFYPPAVKRRFWRRVGETVRKYI
jgi:hypothetical protein